MKLPLPAFLVALTLTAALPAHARAETPPPPPPWVKTGADKLAGENLDPVEAFKVQNRLPGYMVLMGDYKSNRNVHTYRNWVSNGIFQIDGDNGVFWNEFPGNEIADVLAGSIDFMDTATGKRLHFEKGGIFIIPRGWSGIFTFKDFREQATVCTKDWGQRAPFDPDKFVRDPSRMPVAVDPQALHAQAQPFQPDARYAKLTGGELLGGKIIDGEVAVTYYEAPKGGSLQLAPGAPEDVIRVLDGELTLVQGKQKEVFRPGESVATTTAFTGHWLMAPGFRAIVSSCGG